MNTLLQTRNNNTTLKTYSLSTALTWPRPTTLEPSQHGDCAQQPFHEAVLAIAIAVAVARAPDK